MTDGKRCCARKRKAEIDETKVTDGLKIPRGWFAGLHVLPNELLEVILAQMDYRQQHRLSRVSRRWQTTFKRLGVVVIQQDIDSPKTDYLLLKDDHLNGLCRFILRQKGHIHTAIFNGAFNVKTRSGPAQSLAETQSQEAHVERDIIFCESITNVLSRLEQLLLEDPFIWTPTYQFVNIASDCHTHIHYDWVNWQNAGSLILFRSFVLSMHRRDADCVIGVVPDLVGNSLQLKPLCGTTDWLNIVPNGDYSMKRLPTQDVILFLASLGKLPADYLNGDDNWEDDVRVFCYLPVVREHATAFMKVTIIDEDNHMTLEEKTLSGLYVIISC